MERRFNLGRIIVSVIAVFLVVLFLLMLYNDSRLQNFFNPDYQQNSEYNYEQEQTIIQNITKVQASMDRSFNSMVLYTDEYGGNGVLARHLHDIINNDLFSSLNTQLQQYPRIIGHSLDMPVSNFEVHDEPFETIMARIGVETIFTAQRFTLPASSDEQAYIKLKTIANTPVIFSNQQYTSLGTVTINGVTGQLSRPIIETGEEDNGVFLFRRSQSGEEMKILSGAKVTLEASEKYKDSFPVIFFGNNDYPGIQKYVNSITSVIEHQNISNKYIIICRTPANSELDEIMNEKFGINYIRIDENDEPIDYSDLAEKIYYRMKTLKYLDIISSSVSKAEKRIFPQE